MNENYEREECKNANGEKGENGGGGRDKGVIEGQWLTWPCQAAGLAATMLRAGLPSVVCLGQV